MVHARREVLDVRNPGFKMRQLEGSARDWLHGEAASQLGSRSPEFVRGLVHATFRDNEGYVEGLSEQEVDEFLERFGGA